MATKQVAVAWWVGVSAAVLVTIGLLSLAHPVAAGPLFDVSTVESDSDGANELNGLMADGWSPTSKSEVEDMVDMAMSRGLWETAGLLIQVAKKSNFDVTQTVYKSSAEIRKHLKDLEDALLANLAFASRIAPAFQWAQNPDFIFLNVKFAHKLDTPATLGCEADNFTVDGRDFLFTVTCLAKRKAFQLKFEALKPFDKENCTWNMAAVGRAMFTLKKSESGTWPRLLKGLKKPSNMHVWWDMFEKHEDENDKWKASPEAKKKAAEVTETNKQKKAEAAARAAAQETEEDAAPPARAQPTESTKSNEPLVRRRERTADEDEPSVNVIDENVSKLAEKVFGHLSVDEDDDEDAPRSSPASSTPTTTEEAPATPVVEEPPEIKAWRAKQLLVDREFRKRKVVIEQDLKKAVKELDKNARIQSKKASEEASKRKTEIKTVTDQRRKELKKDADEKLRAIDEEWNSSRKQLRDKLNIPEDVRDEL